MNRLAKWMMRLYPAAWRSRYGDEMEALLADSGADAGTIANLLAGGICMRFAKESFFKLALLLSVAGILLGLLVSCLRAPQYVSKATLEMTPGQNQVIQRLTRQVMSRTTLSRIINDPRLDLYSAERRNTPLEDVIDEMRHDISIGYIRLPDRNATAFNIRFTYPDKVKAQQTVLALMNAFVQQNQEIQIGAAQGTKGEMLQVLDSASLPVTPASPARAKFALYGGLLGFLLAGVIAAFGGGGRSPSTPILATNE